MGKFAMVSIFLVCVIFLPIFSFGAESGMQDQSSRGLVVVSAKLSASPSAGVSNSINVGVGEHVLIESGTDSFIKVSLQTGESGWLPKASVAAEINQGGEPCFGLSLEQSVNSELLKNESLKGVSTSPSHYGESIKFSGDLQASVSTDLQFCISLDEPVLLIPIDKPSIGAGAVDASEDKPQRMLLRGKQIVKLVYADGKISGKLEAYCFDESREAPNENDIFRIAGKGELKLTKALSSALNENVVPETIQICVWWARAESLHTVGGIGAAVYRYARNDELPKYGKRFLEQGIVPMFLINQNSLMLFFDSVERVAKIVKKLCPVTTNGMHLEISRRQSYHLFDCLEKGGSQCK